MDRNEPQPAPNPKPERPAPEDRTPSWADDRWISDFENDLGCFSLSSDSEAEEAHVDEMGCLPHGDKPREPRHGPIGI